MLDLLYNNGDLKADEYGDLVLCSDESADIIQTANNNILLRYGHNIYHENLGNKIFTERIKANEGGLNEVADECKRAIIEGDSRVVDVTVMNVTMGENATCIVDYKLLVNGYEGSDYSIDGRVQVNPFNTESSEEGGE